MKKHKKKHGKSAMKAEMPYGVIDEIAYDAHQSQIEHLDRLRELEAALGDMEARYNTDHLRELYWIAMTSDLINEPD